MFERYTERARRALFFARFEVTQHGGLSIEPEHLLLGLLRDPRGLVGRIFAECKASAFGLQHAIEEQVTTSGERTPTSVEIPFSRAMHRVLGFAAEEADRLRHGHIGTEHLLLGVLREERSTAASVLNAHGVRLEGTREAVVRLLRDPSAAPYARERPLVVEASEHAASIRRLVQELEQLAADREKARELARQIDGSLDALMRLFPK